MADRWCDHGLYGAYAATPTWGSAQDGDGTAIGAATPATASIVFTGVPSSGTISVLGVTVSPTWATSADNCANLLATAINAATGTAVSPAGITRKSQVRNHVFARGPAGGAPAGTCQIMMRQGTAAVNSQVAITHTLNNVSSAGTINFSGGAGGAWGFLFNHAATVWASAVGIGGYGIWAFQLPYCGGLDPGDVVKVRSAKTLTLVTGTSVTWTMAEMGSRAAPVRFDIDDGTVWPADGSTPVLKIFKANITNNGQTTNWSHIATTFAYVKAKQYPSGQRSLVVEHEATYATNVPTILLYVGGPIRFDYLDLYCPGTVDPTPGPRSSVSSTLAGQVGSEQNLGTTLYRCRQLQSGFTPSENFYGLVVLSSNTPRHVRLIEHRFELTAATSSWPSGVMLAANTLPNQILELDSCRFIGFIAGSRLLAPLASGSVGNESMLIARNCDFGNILTGPNYLLVNSIGLNTAARGLFVSSQTGTRDFTIEPAGKYYCEWNASRGRPTLNALLLDGVTPWSMFATPAASSLYIGKLSPVDLPCIGKLLPAAVDLAEAPRTFTLNFLLESTAAWTKADVSILVTYVDTAGIARTIDTFDIGGAALDTTTAAWSATSWNGQTWLKRKLEVTTPENVKAESEVGIYVRLHTAAANDTQGIIICPEVLIT